jgi:hypothetical protein
VQGLDEVDVTLQRLPAIEAYEADYRRRYGWMVP